MNTTRISGPPRGELESLARGGCPREARRALPVLPAVAEGGV